MLPVTGVGGLSDAASESVFRMPFAGWLALSDLIAPGAPEFAASMRSAAWCMQSALEQSMSEVLPKIVSVLDDSGIRRTALNQAADQLFSMCLPLSPEAFAEAGRESFAEIYKQGLVARTAQPDDGYLASVLHLGTAALQGQDVDDALPGGRSAAEIAELFRSHFALPHPYRAVASLEMPEIASGRGFSVDCRRPIHRSDNIVVSEAAFTTLPPFVGLRNANVVAAPIDKIYRQGIHRIDPEGFVQNVRSGPDVLYFAFDIEEQRRTGAGRRAAQALAERRRPLRDLVGVGVEAAFQVAQAAAQAHGFPLAVIKPSLNRFAPMLEDRLSYLIERPLSETLLTQWTITLMTLILPELEEFDPLSVFILFSPMEPALPLNQVRIDRNNYDDSGMDTRYEGDYRVKLRARGMIGTSEIPQRPAPTALWHLVGQRKAPVAWRDPLADQGGFRVLVPHFIRGDECSYVSALRADLLPPKT
jgi:hypothetical protein